MKLLRATVAISMLAGLLLSPALAHADDRADVEAATSSWIHAFNRKDVGDAASFVTVRLHVWVIQSRKESRHAHIPED